LRHRSVEVTRSFYARYRDMQLQEVHDQFSADPGGLDLPEHTEHDQDAY
jgi:hypothetical protein